MVNDKLHAKVAQLFSKFAPKSFPVLIQITVDNQTNNYSKHQAVGMILYVHTWTDSISF